MLKATFITNPHSCNLNCDICFKNQAPLDWEPVHEMDFCVVEKVVAELVPLGLKEIIPSTIGEPFLYSHLEDFLKLARSRKLRVSVITNGSFPNGGVKRWAPLLLPVLRDIKFSAMHGKIPEWLRDNIAEFVACLEGSEVKPTVTVQATLGAGDALDDIPAGVNRLKVNEPWFLNSGASIEGSKLSPCPFFGKEIWVWVDGSLQVCPNPDARFGMRTRFPFGNLGNFAVQNSVNLCNNLTFPAAKLCKFCKMRL